jgi:LemA protein
MKKSLIIVAIVIVLAVWGISSYNRFVSLNEGVDSQWAQVESQYQRRFDLIPNLTESVKGIFTQEKTVFTALADARAKYSGAQTIDQKAAAASEVEGALGRLLVIIENYPQLRSSEAVTNLMTQLEGTENRVSVERMRFNDAVKAFNLAIKRFPSNLIAGMAGFDERAYFEAAQGASEAPKVDLQ